MRANAKKVTHSLTGAALLGIAATACPGAGPTKVGVNPSWRATEVEGSATVAEFAPSLPGADEYGHPERAPASTPLGDAVVEAARSVAAARGVSAPVPDARLFAAASELAAVAPLSGVIPHSMVEFSLHRHGVIEPAPHLLVAWGDLTQPAEIAGQLQAQFAELVSLGATTRLGIGTASRGPSGGVIVFIMQGSSIAMQPVPRTVPREGRVPITGRLLGAYRTPEVFVTRDDGSVVSLTAQPGQTLFATELSCEGRRGRQQVEVTGQDASGSTVLANFPVWCGEAPPTTHRAGPADSTPATESDAEQRILALVNQERIAHGASPLAWDERVADVARGHSREMLRTGDVAHISPTTGSASDRVRVAGIKTAAVLENLARAYGVGEAHTSLMNSPGHRANILSPLATHLGVGVLFGESVGGRRELFVTQVFTRVPPKIDARAVAATIRQRLDGVRELTSEPNLERIAQGLADKLASGEPRDPAVASAKRALDVVASRYRRVGSVITAVGDIDAVSAQALLSGSSARELGLGIAQGPSAEIGEGAIWIVLLLGERR